MFKKIVTILITLLTILKINATTTTTNINNIINKIEDEADVALIVTNAKKQTTLYSKNPKHYMQPASTMKLITAVASQYALPEQSPFYTSIAIYGHIKKSTLFGQIHIKGGSDPSLTSEKLTSALSFLKNKNIKTIQGNIYLENNYFDERIFIPGTIWEEINDCYAAPISSLSLDKNCFTVNLFRNKNKIHIKNPLPEQPIKVNIKVKKNFYNDSNTESSIHHTIYSDTALINNYPFSPIQSLDGNCSTTYTEEKLKLSIQNPTLYFKNQTHKILKKLSIKHLGNIKIKNKPTTKLPLLWKKQISSDNKKKLLTNLLKNSDNSIANHLFKKLAKNLNQQESTWENSEKALLQILEKNNIYLNKQQSIADGAGLSRNNRIQPITLSKLLIKIYQRKKLQDIIPMLPISGIDGSLKNRLTNNPLPIYAKTGKLKEASSLAGFIDPYGKKPKTFVLIINGGKNTNHILQSIEDELLQQISNL